MGGLPPHGASKPRLGEVVVFSNAQEKSQGGEKITRHTEKQGNKAHSKEQNKTPDTNSKEM